MPSVRSSVSSKILPTFSLLALAGGSVSSIAAKVPAILNDNILTCGINAECTDKVMFGRKYKVMETAKFTVMVALSNEGHYTRADLSITNNVGYPQHVSPEDFRMEVVGPKTKVLLYVAPTDLHDLPAPRPMPVLAAHPTKDKKAAVTVASVQPLATTKGVAGDAPGAPVAAVPTKPSIEELYGPAKGETSLKEEAEFEAAQKYLPVATIQSNEVVRGRVYFQKAPRSKQVNLVLPISGSVFEFPYSGKL